MFVATKVSRAISATIPFKIVEASWGYPPRQEASSAYQNFKEFEDVEKIREHILSRNTGSLVNAKISHLREISNGLYAEYGFVHHFTQDKLGFDAGCRFLQEVDGWRCISNAWKIDTSGDTGKTIRFSDARFAYNLLKINGPENAEILKAIGVVDDSGTHFNLNPSSRIVVPAEGASSVKVAYEDFINFLNEVESAITLPWSRQLFIYNTSRIIIHPE